MWMSITPSRGLACASALDERKAAQSRIANRLRFIETFLGSAMDSVEFLDPDIAYGDFGWSAFEFDSDLAGEVVGGGRIVVDQTRHKLAVKNMEKGAATGDDLVLVPVIDFDVTDRKSTRLSS